MGKIDGTWSAFNDYPGYGDMAPCMRGCEDDMYFNGCDQSRCWCTKPNLDLRIQYITRCASSSCTFANMNTQTDVDIISGIQVMYCADKGFSPAGMAMPSTADAQQTTSGSSPRVTGTGETGTRPRASNGPANTGSSSSSNNNSNTSSGGGGGGLSPSTIAGIAISAAFCALVAILICVILFKRRKRITQVLPPPNGFQNNGIPPPQMAPTPYSGNGPFSPPPLQQPAPIAIPQNITMKGIGNGADVSPIEEKAPAAVTIPRKEIGSPVKYDISNPSTPAPAFAHIADNNTPREVQGSVPPPRHEFSNDGQITNTVSTRGMELDSNNIASVPVNQYPGQQQYQQSGQGQWGGGYGAPSYEVDGGWNGQQRHELPPGQHGGPPQQQVPHYGQYGTYELGNGR